MLPGSGKRRTSDGGVGGIGRRFAPPLWRGSRERSSGTHLLTVWTGEVVSGCLQVVLQGPRGGVLVDAFDTPGGWGQSRTGEGEDPVSETIPSPPPPGTYPPPKCPPSANPEGKILFNSFSDLFPLFACHCLHSHSQPHLLGHLSVSLSAATCLLWAIHQREPLNLKLGWVLGLTVKMPCGVPSALIECQGESQL